MTPDEYARIVASAAGAAVVAGLVAALVLRALRRAPVFVHIIIIVVAAVAAVAGGIGITAVGMYISSADTAVALTVTAVSGIVAVVMAALLGRRLSRDARGLGDDARRLGAGEAVAPAARVSTELDAVQRELVDSSARLQAAREASERAEQARRDLVARIAHDLLAPLASIRAIAESIDDGMAPSPEEAARRLGTHTERLQSLVGDLFELSRIDAGALELSIERVSLADLASDVVADFADLARRHDRALVVQVEGEVLGDADPRSISRALVNLVVNGLEHAPAGGTVEVAAMVDGEHAVLRVTDTGEGFAGDAAERAFEAGWRASSARTAPRLELAGGAGLGLAITRAIVEAHGGTVHAGNAPAGGGRVELRLPSARARQSDSAAATREG